MFFKRNNFCKEKQKLSKRSHVFTYWLTSMPLSDESMKWVEIISEVPFIIFNALSSQKFSYCNQIYREIPGNLNSLEDCLLEIILTHCRVVTFADTFSTAAW